MVTPPTANWASLCVVALHPPPPPPPPLQLGTYDPIASRDGVKEVRVKVDRMKYWLSVGAQPSETVARLLAHVGMLPPPPIRCVPCGGGWVGVEGGG